MKHRILYSIFLGVILISCGGGETDGTTPGPTPTPPKVTNTAPTVPTLTSPTNSKLCINNTISFEWNASTDAESNAIVYQIQIATDAEFTKDVITKEVSSPIYSSAPLDKGKAYYWRVKATDSNSASSAYSSVFNLYTEGIALTNHIPFAPQLVAPLINTIITGSTTTLSWIGSDVDADLLTYDVYLGTESTPITKVVDNKSDKTFFTASLQASKIYYWRVIVKDGKGGKTEGQIWSFLTK